MKIHRPVAMLSLGLVLGLGAGALGTSIANSQAPAPTPPVVLAQMPLSSATFAKLAEKIKPAVINVNTERKGAGRTPMDEFFGDAPERMPRRSLGSGVIIDPAGVALTNAHVVADADSGRGGDRGRQPAQSQGGRDRQEDGPRRPAARRQAALEASRTCPWVTPAKRRWATGYWRSARPSGFRPR